MKKKQDKKLIYFKLTYELEESQMHLINEGNTKIEHGKWTYLLEASETGVDHPVDFSITTLFERKIKQEMYDALKTIRDGKYKFLSLSFDTDGTKSQSVSVSSGKEGERYDLEKSYVSYFQSLLEEMVSAATNVFALAGWRVGSALDLSDLPDKAKLHWSENNKLWHRLLIRRNSGFITMGGAVQSSEDVGDELENLIKQGEKAPVYRTFIDQAMNNYKLDSSLVMAVAALEIAVKNTIQKVHPETDWLLREIPSPPVLKILRDYIPTLNSPFIDDEDGLVAPQELLEEIQKAVNARNDIVHKGSIDWSEKRRYESIVKMELVIRWLEYFQGHIWSPSRTRQILNQGLVVK